MIHRGYLSSEMYRKVSKEKEGISNSKETAECEKS